MSASVWLQVSPAGQNVVAVPVAALQRVRDQWVEARFDELVSRRTLEITEADLADFVALRRRAFRFFDQRELATHLSAGECLG